MAALSITCPSCQSVLKLPENFPPGAKARCTKCSTPIVLPSATAKANTQSALQGEGSRLEATDASSAERVDESSYLEAPKVEGELGRLGSYRILSKLGEGGMGLVYEAEDTKLRRKVALKVMLPKHAANGTAKARFLREARAQAAVEHEHVAAIHIVGDDQAVPYIAMPLLKGQTLQAALKANPKPPVNEVLRLGQEMAEGLAAAHAIGLIHRDIKPANVWLEGSKRKVKILDFGLARAMAGAEVDVDESEGPKTQQGTMLGTPAYMSPEQGRGDELDARSDLFSLGVVLYEMATGERPFKGKDVWGILTSLAVDNPAPPHTKNHAIPESLSAFIVKMLAKNPAERPQSGEEVASALRAIDERAKVLPVVYAPAAVPLVNDPWENIDATDTGDSRRSASANPASVSATVAADAPRSSKKPLLIGLGGMLAAMVLGVIIIKITNKDGSVTELKVPEGSKIEIVKAPEPKKDPVAKVEQESKKEPPVATAMSDFDRLTSPDWEWTTPVNLGPNINSDKNESSVSLTADGLLMIFHSKRSGNHELYECRRTSPNEPFGVATLISTWPGADKAGCSLSPDGLTLLFHSSDNLAGSCGGHDLYQTQRKSRDSAWEPPVNLGVGINTNLKEMEPCLSPDGLELYFVRSQKTETGVWWSDLWIARRKTLTSPFETAVLFGEEVNKSRKMSKACLGPDGKTLVYSESEKAPPIQVAIRDQSGKWKTSPIVLPNPNPFARIATLAPDGVTLYFSSRVLHGHGEDDIWMTKRMPRAKVSPPLAKAPFDAVQAKSQQEAWAKHLGVKVETPTSAGGTMVVIPPGEGVAKPFYMGKYEVTQGEWEKVMGYNPSEFGPKNVRVEGMDTSKFPVEKVTWFDCLEFCNKLSEKEGLKPYYELMSTEREGPSIEQARVKILGGNGYHIPTDAEWTWACAAGAKTKFHFGSREENLPEYAWFDQNSDGRTHRVGEKKPNAFGLYDIHGNVREWNEEILTKTDGAQELVFRGGYWNYTPESCAVSNRNRSGPANRIANIGLRLARVPASELGLPADESSDARNLQVEWTAKLKMLVESTSPTGIAMVLIPPGEGVAKPFLMGKYEVTQGEWGKVMGYNPSQFKVGNAKLAGQDASKFAVETVNWFDCVEFCNKLSEKEGLTPYYELTVTERSGPSIEQADVKILGGSGYHIPTDAEWTWACAAGAKTKFHFGSREEDLPLYAWFDQNSDERTHRVGEKKPNAFGLYDVQGNVREWNEEMLTKADGALERVSRGGYWNSTAAYCAVNSRSQHAPAYRHYYIGLRLVRVP